MAATVYAVVCHRWDVEEDDYPGMDRYGEGETNRYVMGATTTGVDRDAARRGSLQPRATTQSTVSIPPI